MAAAPLPCGLLCYSDVTTALRPLTLGELLDRTFQLYRRHFVAMVGIVALPHLLVLAVQLVQVAVHPPVLDSKLMGLAEFGQSMAWLFVILILAVMAGA